MWPRAPVIPNFGRAHLKLCLMCGVTSSKQLCEMKFGRFRCKFSRRAGVISVSVNLNEPDSRSFFKKTD
jgi:hypothetical protein